MTKLNIYRCDRCGKTFKISDYEVPAIIRFRDCRSGTMSEINASQEEYQLCMDCSASFSFFMSYKGYGKRIDELIDTIIKEEENIPN